MTATLLLKSERSAYIATGEVTALQHELRDHTMELRVLIAKALLTSAKSTEVLGGLRDDIVIEGKVDSAGLVWSKISMAR